MEQPKVYNKEEELIKWLEYDLKEQRKEIAKDRGISLNDVKEEELVLHIVNKNFKSIEKIEINFEFDFSAIIKKINIKNNEIYYKVNCANLIFSKMVDFSDKKHNNKVVFYNEVKFDNSNFNELTNFVNISFEKNANFSNTIFNKRTYFNNIVFNCIVYFRSISIYQIEFGNIIIKENFNLSIMNEKENDKVLIFKNIKFENEKSNLNIFNINMKINKFSLNNTIINGIVNIKNAEVETVDFKGSIINGGWVNPVKFKVHNFANRESALFLKNEAYARNNIIDALEYKAKEIELHKKELLKNKKDYKDWGDIFSIYLSSLYSDNGLNWVKSFLCTILFSILFFTISYNISCIPIFTIAFISILYVLLYNKNILNHIFVSAIIYIIVSIVFSFIYFEGYNNIDYVIKELFSFIAPTNFSQILYDKEYLSYIYDCKSNIKIICFIEIVFKGILYFLGKIAFWYGSVQTVQAFRKFSKKE